MKKQIIFWVLLVILLWVMGVCAEEETLVYIEQESFDVSAGDTFDVNISCLPDRPIKAFEFGLVFDSSLLKVNSVSEGNIFDGFTTFFYNGTIDNSAGKIYDVYNLIMGQGNVSEEGTMVTISFTAKDKSGTTNLDINGVGITDESGYISFNVLDGSVSVQGGGNGGDSPGGGFIYFPPSENDNNNPPKPPMKPSGPTYIEIGVKYEYSSFSSDVDGDLIRYRFDWGDSALSNWSEFIESNVSVNASHVWSNYSEYYIKVIAQDEQGENSSWSIPLNITVSTSGFGGNPPYADISFPVNITANSTVVFDASGSFDKDGFIVSYYWDFGDGEKASGMNPLHQYKKPGEYLVTLVVKDNDGYAFSKSVVIVVGSEVLKESGDKSNGAAFDFVPYLIVIVVMLIALLGIYYRDKIRSILPEFNLDFNFLSKIFDTELRIKYIDKRISVIKRDMSQDPRYAKQEKIYNISNTDHDDVIKLIDANYLPKMSIKSVSDNEPIKQKEKNFESPNMNYRYSHYKDKTNSIKNLEFDDKKNMIDNLKDENIEEKIDRIINSKIRAKIDNFYKND